jgi:uncharacterized SAM-binding protein YcdF (DUF218 family)
MRRARLPLVFAVLALFWLLATGWLTAPLLYLAQRDTQSLPPPTYRAHTVIVLLGGGTEYDDADRLVPKPDALIRVITGADVYSACKQTGARCDVVISGGNPQHHEQAEADNYLPYLLQ